MRWQRTRRILKFPLDILRAYIYVLGCFALFHQLDDATDGAILDLAGDRNSSVHLCFWPVST